ncbi:MAG: hypothetical protein DI539_09195 [Flavobacterium psychrophilum]|nr:MAG: hypothetical protein DI539_09195 [Flavobacterium psychrophilum]
MTYSTIGKFKIPAVESSKNQTIQKSKKQEVVNTKTVSIVYIYVYVLNLGILAFQKTKSIL